MRPTAATVVGAAALLAVAQPARADAVDAVVAATCPTTPALALAARLALAEHAPLDTEALRDAAERAGVYAPAVRAWVARGDERAVADAAGTWLRAQRVAPTWAQCAVAHAGTEWAVTVVPRAASVEGVSAHAAVGDVGRYRVVLPPGAERGALLVARPDAVVERYALAESVSVAFGTAGTYTLQVLADTASGPLPFAVWHVHAGAASTPVAAASQPVRDAREALAAINRRRTAAGIEPLRWDPFLATLAEERAATLAARGEVVHALAPGDSPVARLAAAGLAADRVAENVARAPTLAGADARLAASPSHHANRTDPALDAAGIGVARQGDAVYLVEIYAARPRLRGR